ncbi:MAG: SUMF1/EgtB/PvdO family nonheme iron enzyme [Phycisphaerales bacterium]
MILLWEIVIVAALGSGGGVPSFVEIKPLVAAPSDSSQWDSWRKELAAAREQVALRLGYRDDLYRRGEFAWAASCYCCCFTMMYDQRFYDPVGRRYTVAQYIEDGRSRFGGYDAVVLWHAYPRIGFDDRNQFDFYRDMPGGLAGLRELSRAIHEQGVRVFINYNPWDTGTRREARSDAEMLVELVSAIEADGIFLDTLHEGMSELRDRLDAARPGVVLESELTLPVERIGDHHMSWAQWVQDSDAPGVLWNKWFERRHVMHQIRRWDRDHTAELQMAWMNGSGMLVWENVFGSWVGWNPRNRSILRSMLPIQRRYVRLLSGDNWTPLVPTEHVGIYASLWQGEGLRLWTLINRTEQTIEGVLMKVPDIEGHGCYDLLAGRELSRVEDGQVLLDVRIGPRGIGAFVAGTRESLGKDFDVFLAGQMAIRGAASEDPASPSLQETLRPVERTFRYGANEIPKGMVAVPAAPLRMKTEYRNRECGFHDIPGQELPAPPSRDLHKTVSFTRDVELSPYAIDVTPVTNAQYAEFLRSTGYRPADEESFLKHWENGRVPSGLEDHPVVYVDLQDARAYARWARKRLATEEEWQYAAHGPDGFAYPWGNEWRAGRCNEGHSGDTTAVTAFAEGRSPFGCYDMCGNVWEWTESERSDGRTRFCILKGGSYYKAIGSEWYADGGPKRCDFSAKFLLMWPGLDRCATIGFRCAVDLADSSP